MKKFSLHLLFRIIVLIILIAVACLLLSIVVINFTGGFAHAETIEPQADYSLMNVNPLSVLTFYDSVNLPYPFIPSFIGSIPTPYQPVYDVIVSQGDNGGDNVTLSFNYLSANTNQFMESTANYKDLANSNSNTINMQLNSQIIRVDVRNVYNAANTIRRGILIEFTGSTLTNIGYPQYTELPSTNLFVNRFRISYNSANSFILQSEIAYLDSEYNVTPIMRAQHVFTITFGSQIFSGYGDNGYKATPSNVAYLGITTWDAYNWNSIWVYNTAAYAAKNIYETAYAFGYESGYNTGFFNGQNTNGYETPLKTAKAIFGSLYNIMNVPIFGEHFTLATLLSIAVVLSIVFLIIRFARG